MWTPLLLDQYCNEIQWLIKSQYWNIHLALQFCKCKFTAITKLAPSSYIKQQFLIFFSSLLFPWPDLKYFTFYYTKWTVKCSIKSFSNWIPLFVQTEFYQIDNVWFVIFSFSTAEVSKKVSFYLNQDFNT